MSKWTDVTRIPAETRTATFLRDGERCVYCDTPRRLECAHVVPRRRGGKGVITNLVTLCHGCHQKMDYYAWTDEGKEIELYVQAYIRMLYPGWSDEDQIYHKYEGV